MHKQQQDSGNKMSEAWKHYQGANKDVKKSVRKDKGELVENLAEQIGNEPGQKNMKELCDATRKITGKHRTGDRLIVEKSGNLFNKQRDKLKRWVEHFKECTKRLPPMLKFH